MRWTVIIAFLLLSVHGFSRKIIVGPNEQVRTLKKAFELAQDYDTILVNPGLYREGSLQLTKSVTLLGKNLPVLDGEKKYEILLVSGANIRISGFHFRNSGYSALNDYASIKVVDSENILIDNNQVSNAYFAIHISNSTRIQVKNNRIEGTPLSEQMTGNAIHLWKCSKATIEGNDLRGHRDGIYFEFVTQSEIRRNLSQKNIRYGLHFMFSNDDHYQGNTFRNNGAGVAVMYSKKVTMDRNHFEENWGPSSYGLLLKDITDSHLSNCTFYKNTTGIHMEGSSRMIIEKTWFKENGWALKVQASCDNNVFKQNNFTGNSFDVGTNGSLSLNEFSGNYWDKYEGYDIDKNGIGDIPYHPVSMYSMIVEQNPNALMLLRSFMVQLLDKAEKAIPSLTPENLADKTPRMKLLKL